MASLSVASERVVFAMVRHVCALVAVLALAGISAIASAAEELTPMSAESSQLYARHLTELAQKEHKEPQVKFEVDPERATGLHAGDDGILIVPIKGLKEGEINPAVETENGGGLCYLFMSPCFAPVVDGKPIEGKKLRKVKFNDGNGADREAICLIVSVKHVEGDDWRLYAFGADKSPVINSPFSDAPKNGEGALTLAVKGGQENRSNLTLTLFKKYSASFTIGSK
jgi:hypothetical protein